jgi:uncharacterized protein (DUF1697 family)
MLPSCVMVLISLLRGVNLGKRRMRMEALRATYEGLGLTDVRTLLQSGNVLFRSTARDLPRLTAKIEKAIAADFGFHSDVFIRSPEELRSAIAGCPFSRRGGIDPAKLAVTFTAAAPEVAARQRLAAIQGIPEELCAGERELYVYYPNGMGRPVLTAAMLDKALGKLSTTTRNWNTVTKLLAMAEEMEAAR